MDPINLLDNKQRNRRRTKVLSQAFLATTTKTKQKNYPVSSFHIVIVPERSIGRLFLLLLFFCARQMLIDFTDGAESKVGKKKKKKRLMMMMMLPFNGAR